MTDNESNNKEEKNKLDSILDYDPSKKDEELVKKCPMFNKKSKLIITLLGIILIIAVSASFFFKKESTMIDNKKNNEINNQEINKDKTKNKNAFNEKEKNYIDNNILFYQFYYQNSSIYYNLCKNNGYEINNYISVFNEKFKNQIDETEHFFEIFKASSPNLKQDLNNDIETRMSKRVEDEINMIRKGIITQEISENQKIPFEKVVWDNSYYEAFPISAACKYLDENADNVLSSTYQTIIPLFK